MVSAITVATSGTDASSSPVSELEIRVSAAASSTHGIAISIAAKARMGIQCGSNGRSSFRATAIGSRIAAAIPVRARTSTAGLMSSTATLIRRYGIPQITHMAANSSQPRRDISLACSYCASALAGSAGTSAHRSR